MEHPSPEIVQRARAGDPEAFAALHAAYDDRLVRHAHRILGDWEEAREVASTSWRRALESISRTRTGHLHVQAWLHRIAGNLARDALRKRRTRPTVSLDAMQSRASSDEHGGRLRTARVLNHSGAADAVDPLEVVERRENLNELASQLAAMMARLDPSDVDILVRRANGETYRQIADALEVTVPDVKGMVERARTRARALMPSPGAHNDVTHRNDASLRSIRGSWPGPSPMPTPPVHVRRSLLAGSS